MVGLHNCTVRPFSRLHWAFLPCYITWREGWLNPDLWRNTRYSYSHILCPAIKTDLWPQQKMPVLELVLWQVCWQGTVHLSVQVCAHKVPWWWGTTRVIGLGVNHATLGRFLALDNPCATGVGHAPVLHWRPLGKRQWPSRSLQPGALKDLG